MFALRVRQVRERAAQLRTAARAVGCTANLTGRCLRRARLERGARRELLGRSVPTAAAAEVERAAACRPAPRRGSVSEGEADEADGGFLQDAREKWAPAIFDITAAKLTVHGRENITVGALRRSMSGREEAVRRRGRRGKGEAGALVAAGAAGDSAGHEPCGKAARRSSRRERRAAARQRGGDGKGVAVGETDKAPGSGALSSAASASRLGDEALLTEATGAVFVANHASFMDIPACFAAVPGDLRFVAKKSISYLPLVGEAMRTAGMVFVDRKKPQEAVAALKRSATAAAHRARPTNIMAFPEGTRSADGRVGSFKKGIFHMAIDAQKPVVPTALVGTNDVLPKSGPLGAFSFRKDGHVGVAFGRPISTDGLTSKDVDRLVEEVHAEVLRLHAQLSGKGAVEATCAEAA